jgi:hypothetical protein
MKAYKDWGPYACNCGKFISKDAEFVIIEGTFYLSGHDKNREKPQTPTITKRGKAKNSRKENSDQLPLFDRVGSERKYEA